MVSAALVKKKALTSIRLLVTLDFSGLSSRIKRKLGVYGSPALLAKSRFQAKALEALDQFLFTQARIGLDTVENADVAIVIILWNKGELTYQCLQSLTSLSSRHVKFSVLIIDNASSDITSTLLSRVDGATIVRNEKNVGFLKACNQARDLLSTPYVLFLNNDTIVHPGAVEAAIACIVPDPTIGAVGARVILPDGKLQEAGNILWSDGTCQGYARGKVANASEAMFRRPTDYCSGAFLLTRTALFKKFDGFDERYLPAYYEETDYCVNLWKAGYKVVYEPKATITHFEFGSSELSASAFALMATNRLKFLEKHREFLAGKDLPPSNPLNTLNSRVPKEFRSKKRVLYIEDRIPNKALGAGFPRSNNTIRELHAFGYDVTVFSAIDIPYSWSDNYSDIPSDIEIIREVGLSQLASFMTERAGFYDAVWVCRPDNFEHIIKNKQKIFGSQKVPLVYDGEAIFSDREQAYFAVHGTYKSKWTKIELEFALAKHADVIVAVSEAEAKKWREGTGRPTYVVGHDYKVDPTPKNFSERKDLLFVGSFHGKDTPNGDSLVWFLTEIMPRVKAKLGKKIKLNLVGFFPLVGWDLLEKYSEDLNIVGRVEELRPAFDSARVVIMPTRYASGIPQKAFDAAEHGVPVVCTDLIADQMEWTSGLNTLSAKVNDAEQFAEHCVKLYSSQQEWERIRSNLIKFMQDKAESYSVRAQLQRCLEQTFSARRL